MNKNDNKFADEKQQQKIYKYVQQVEFHSNNLIQYVMEKNGTLYIQNDHDKVLMIKLFALNRQQKMIKKVEFLAEQIYFMNQSKKFIVSSCGMIQIWRQDNQYNWKKIKTIRKDQKDFITSIIINHNDNQIASLLEYGTIEFRSQESEWNCYFKLDGSFQAIEFNKKSNKLVAIDDNSIFVFKYTPLRRNKKWTQKEQIQEKFKSIYFLEEDNFISWSGQEKSIFYFQIGKFSKLVKLKRIQLYGLTISEIFILTYLKQNTLILIQNGNQLIKVKDTCDKVSLIQQALPEIEIIKEVKESIYFTFIQQGDFLSLIQFDDKYQCRKMELRKFVQLTD